MNTKFRPFPDGIVGESTLTVGFAMQLCDVANYQSDLRPCADRTELSKRSVRSFVGAIQSMLQHFPRVVVHVCFVQDRITSDLRDFCQALIARNVHDRLFMSDQDIAPQQGIADSIKSCYDWMNQQSVDLVGQFQDDYLFHNDCFIQTIDTFLRAQREFNTDVIVNPHIWWPNWQQQYHGRATPRVIFLSTHQYWVQLYDLSCSFVTSHRQFVVHKDLYEKFLQLCKAPQMPEHLESLNLNLMTTQRGVLALSPMRSLSLHIQYMKHASFVDPHQDWRELWNSIDIENITHDT